MQSKLLIILLLAVHLLGCATVHQGNFTKVPTSLNTTISNDSVQRLGQLYPPARTHFHVKQSVKDSFGLSFIETLRHRGYSINEGSDAPNSSDIALYYLLDEPVKGTLYRITVIVGDKSLSRAYKIKNGAITPLGFWVRKE